MANTGVSTLVHAPRSKQEGYPYRGNKGIVPSRENIVFFDDFFSTPATNVPPGWAAAIIDTGATVTQLSTNDYPGGVLVFASDGTSEGASIYLPKSIQLSSTKRMFMEARVLTTDANQTDIQMGLSSLTGTTNPEDLWTTTATDLIAFGPLAGSEYPSFLIDKNNGGSAAKVTTEAPLKDSTWHVLGLEINGDSKTVLGYIDGNYIGFGVGGTTYFPDNLVLAPFIGARTGATASNVVYVDYFRFSINR